jgi:hypothetical protein
MDASQLQDIVIGGMLLVGGLYQITMLAFMRRQDVK